MAFCLSCVLLLSMLVNLAYGGPGHSHKHKHSSEGEWRIKMQVDAGNGDATWTITNKEMTKDKNVKTIITAIEWYEHNRYNATVDNLPNDPVGGYQGFKFDHVINGKTQHTWTMPRCKLPNLELALIRITAGKSIRSTNKAKYIAAIENCGGKKKIAT